MMEQKDKAVTSLTKGIEMLFKKNKVTRFVGHGRLADKNKVEILNEDGKIELVEAKNIVIATGSDFFEISGLKFDEKSIISSTGALALKDVPKRMVVIGGGVIGLELVKIYLKYVYNANAVGLSLESFRCRSYRCRIPRCHRCWNGWTDFVINLLLLLQFTNFFCMSRSAFHKILSKQGIKFRLGTKYTGAEKNKDGSYVLSLESNKDGSKDKVSMACLNHYLLNSQIEADVVLVAVGRKPYTENLGLEKVGVKTDEKGRIVVDDKFSTNIPSILAIGDVIRGPMLAHKSEEEGIAVAEILAGGYGHVNYEAIPSVVYTHPEVAWCGKTEEELKKSGIEYSVGSFPFLANSRAKTNGNICMI